MNLRAALKYLFRGGADKPAEQPPVPKRQAAPLPRKMPPNLQSLDEIATMPDGQPVKGNGHPLD